MDAYRRLSRYIKFLCLFAFITTSNLVFAGSAEQKQQLNSIMADLKYANLFSYYDAKNLIFSEVKYTIGGKDYLNRDDIPGYPANSDDILVTQIISDDAALSELYTLITGIQNARTLPYYVSKEARDYADKINDELESEFPKATYDELWDKAIKMERSIIAGLSNKDIGLLVFNAALTGPKLGLDIASGGFSKLGSAVLKGQKALKSVKVVKNYKKIKLEPVLQYMGKISSKLDNIDSKAIASLKSQSKNSKRLLALLDMMESEEYQIFKKIFKYGDKYAEFIKGLTEERRKRQFIEQLTAHEQALISEYAEKHKDDTTNYIAHFYADLLSDAAIDVIKALDQSKVATFLLLLKTGVVSAFSDDPELDWGEEALKVVTDVGLQAGEFVPIAGPFVELININAEAVSTAKANRKEALAMANLYTNARNDYEEQLRNIYNLMVLEEIIVQIQANDNEVFDTLNFNEYFGVRVALNSIAGAIYDSEKTTAQKIYDDLRDCRIARIAVLAGKPQSVPSKIISEKVSTRCDAERGVFSAYASVPRGYLGPENDYDVELYVTIKDLKLYKLKASGNFVDVLPQSQYYPYVKAFAQDNVINSNNSYFLPNKETSKYEFMVMVVKALYRKEFLQYKNDNPQFSEQSSYLAFASSNFNWLLDETEFDTSILGQDVAEILYRIFERELILSNQPEPHDGKIVLWSVGETKYTSKIDIQNGWGLGAAFLKAIGVDSGTSRGTYESSKAVTRGKAVMMLSKAKQLLEESE